jgi:hypothetical protein
VWMKTTDGKIQHLYAGTSAPQISPHPTSPRNSTIALTIAHFVRADNKTAYHCYLAGHSLYVVSCACRVCACACACACACHDCWSACSLIYVFFRS